MLNKDSRWNNWKQTSQFRCGATNTSLVRWLLRAWMLPSMTTYRLKQALSTQSSSTMRLWGKKQNFQCIPAMIKISSLNQKMPYQMLCLSCYKLDSASTIWMIFKYGEIGTRNQPRLLQFDLSNVQTGLLARLTRRSTNFWIKIAISGWCTTSRATTVINTVKELSHEEQAWLRKSWQVTQKSCKHMLSKVTP